MEVHDRSREVFWRRFAAVLGIVLVAGFVQTHLVIPATPSIRYHLLWVSPGDIEKGDYVNVRVQNDIIDKERAVTLTKRVACVAGEYLDFSDGEHYCNGQWLGRVLARTRDGVPLAPFVYSGPVPEGKVFLAGENHRSFDSRYFGFVDRDALTRVLPVL